MRKTAAQIMKIVQDHLAIDITEVNRRRDYADARAMYYKLCKDFTNETYSNIGKLVGRDHSTVIHGVNNVFPVIDQSLYKVLYKNIKNPIKTNTMQQSNERYNGWTNFATWKVQELLISDMEFDNYVNTNMVKDIVNKVVFENPDTCNTPTLVETFARSFAAEVNYYEIASMINENIDQQKKLQA